MAKKATTDTAAPAAEPKIPSKVSQVIDLLRRAEGATLEEMTAATGWQPHSARAVLTGLRKKGHVIAREKRDDVTCYRITETVTS